ncbi:hypothetical protein NQZ68_024383 [Dissostichus eleginoides]|nr:hypothetical protein NQZ68_024383 [Dissostichus eleginoides]
MFVWKWDASLVPPFFSLTLFSPSPVFIPVDRAAGGMSHNVLAWKRLKRKIPHIIELHRSRLSLYMKNTNRCSAGGFAVAQFAFPLLIGKHRRTSIRLSGGTVLCFCSRANS